MTFDKDKTIKLDPKDQNRCANPKCENPDAHIDDDDQCSGCGFFVCMECDTEEPMGHHDVIEHWSGE